MSGRREIGRPSVGAFVRGALVASLLGGLACAGVGGSGVRSEDLPTHPIAVRYWTEADARSRLEVEQGAPTGGPGSRRLGIATADALRAFIQGGTLVPGVEQYPGALVLIDPRSGEITPVEGAPRGSQPLAWSADKERLLFSAVRTGRARSELFEYWRTTGEVRPVVPAGDDFAHLRGDYGPGGAVAFSRYRLAKDPDPTLWVRPPRGQAFQLGSLYADTVRWSPSGDGIAVGERLLDPSLRGARSWRILRFDVGPLEGDAASQAAPWELRSQRVLGPGRHPSFSPDGAWIVYSAPAAGGWRLQRMRPDGSARSPVGRGVPSRNEQMPSVSPDGRYVAFVADEGGLARLFVRRMDGQGERFVVSLGAVSGPVW